MEKFRVTWIDGTERTFDGEHEWDEELLCIWGKDSRRTLVPLHQVKFIEVLKE